MTQTQNFWRYPFNPTKSICIFQTKLYILSSADTYFKNSPINKNSSSALFWKYTQDILLLISTFQIIFWQYIIAALRKTEENLKTHCCEFSNKGELAMKCWEIIIQSKLGLEPLEIVAINFQWGHQECLPKRKNCK